MNDDKNLCTAYEDLIGQQREYFTTGATLPVEFRIAELKKLKAMLIKNQVEIEVALKSDLGKSSFETYMGEVGPLLAELNLHIRSLKGWAKTRRVKTPIFLKPSYSRIMYEPYGVTLILSPWNYPLQLAIMPLIGAISAGNTAILKPSELSPATAELLDTMISNTFDTEYVTVIKGGIPETTALLKQRFDFIFFTGSTNVGKIVAGAAAENLTPTVLELGGKSPAIFDDTAKFKVAIKRMLLAKISNSGQTCVAPDYILVAKSRKDEFVEESKKVIQEFFPGLNLDVPSTYEGMAKIVNDSHFQRLTNLLEGEEVIFGGKIFEPEKKIQPTLVDCGDVGDYLRNGKNKTAIIQEEIFGPILPILTYESLKDVISYVNSSEKPLSLYIFSENKITQKEILKSISFGGGCINDSLMHLANDNLPFGGVGYSGQGSYHGKSSFLAFSHEKSLLYTPTWFDLSLKYMPYTEKKLKWLRKLLK